MRIAIVYNEFTPSYYDAAGEQKAVLGVLDAVHAVSDSLIELGHDVAAVPLSPPLVEAQQCLDALDADLVFNLFEGFAGDPESEAEVAGYLERLTIPVSGCPAPALRLGLDKAATKLALRRGGIDTPDFQLLNPAALRRFRLKFPCIIKPNGEDGSHGITDESVVGTIGALRARLEQVLSLYGGETALVEEYIDGREFNTTVIGNGAGRVLDISEIAFTLPAGMPRILTYAGKWETESEWYRGTTAVCPARIPDALKHLIAGVAERAFAITGCRGYARVDMRLGTGGRITVIEVNPNPDISPGSGAALQAKAAGMTYTRFIEEIVRLAREEVTSAC